MPAKNTRLLRLTYFALPGLVKLDVGRAGRHGCIDDWGGVVNTHLKMSHGLFKRRHRPGLMKIGQRTSRQFGHPLPHEYPLRVVFMQLLDGIVNPDRIRARHARLHLNLRVMNAWFEIRVEPGPMPAPFLLMLQQMVG